MLNNSNRSKSCWATKAKLPSVDHGPVNVNPRSSDALVAASGRGHTHRARAGDNIKAGGKNKQRVGA